MTIRTILLGLLAALVLAACGAEATPTESTTPTEVPTQAAAEGADTSDEPEGDLPPPPEDEGSATTFAIVPGESEARFYIDETLFGNDITVEGVNNNVNGEVVVDYDNLTATTFRPITIDATTFVTDNNNRNGAIRRFVLETGQPGNETITFEINNVDGLPEAATIGESYEVTIDGLLTMHGVSNPATFTGTLTAVSETRISGSLSTGQLDYTEWDISIPQPPSVSFIADTMRLEFDFVADAQ